MTKLSDPSQRETHTTGYRLCVKPENDRNEPINTISRSTDTDGTLMFTQRERRRVDGEYGINRCQDITYKTDKQEGLTVQHRKLYSISCHKLYGKE